MSNYLDDCAYAIVRLTGLTHDGKETIGTGFLYTHIFGENAIDFLVTNAHCLTDLKQIEITFSQETTDKNSETKSETVILLNFNWWFYHPDTKIDLCIFPTTYLLNESKNFGQKIYHKTFYKSNCITEEQLSLFGAVENVVVIGYPGGLYDSYNNKPIYKTGTTATSLALNYLGKREFLINSSAIVDSSGSPVLLSEKGLIQSKFMDQRAITPGEKYTLIGVLYSYLTQTLDGEIINTLRPESELPTISRTHIPLQISNVIKVECLIELCELFAKKFPPPTSSQTPSSAIV